MNLSKARSLTWGAAVAALYVVLTLVSHAFGMANGVIQIRISEALCVLPFFSPVFAYGLFVGCILSNIITGCMLWDIILGSLATLIGGLVCAGLGSLARKSTRPPERTRIFHFLTPIPNIVANTTIIPFVLLKVYGLEGSYFYFALTVFVGEFISTAIMGLPLLALFQKIKAHFDAR